MVRALTRVTNLMKGNKPGLVVTDVAKSSDNRLSVALKLFVAVDSARASVTMVSWRSSGRCAGLLRRIL